MLSIIIPTYNEEKFLPSLLDSIKKQRLEKYEIIIADNASKDNTKKIAKTYGCKIVKGGSPPKARNSGAKASNYPNLLFLDADVLLPDKFIEKFLEKIKKNNLDYATCRISPLSKNSNHIFYYMLKNYGNFLFPDHASGQCLYVKKSLFEEAGRFDETLYLGEEHELARRLNKKGKGKFFMDIFVYGYPRRLEKEGTYRSLLKDIISESYRIFIGKIDFRIYDRKYGHY
jgi:glycosyltransferase involved in cell wall biosynthesis